MEARVTAPTSAPMVDEEYWRLVRAFPLVPIRDDAHLERALDIIDRLTDQPHRDAGAETYLGALADLVYVYEQAHVTWPPVRGVDVLQHLMDEHGLSQADLAPLFGGRSVISDVLAGKRRLNLTHVTRLAERFGLPADAFIDRGDPHAL